MLRQYLESVNGRNARFLDRLQQEGVRREMLARLNDLGAVMPQTEPIRSAAVLLAATTALVESRGIADYSAEAIQEVADIQNQLAEDLRKQFFMLRQPDEDAARAEKKALAADLLHNLNLHTVFPSLDNTDRRAHKAVLENLIEEAQTDSNAALYGNEDVWPINEWRP